MTMINYLFVYTKRFVDENFSFEFFEIQVLNKDTLIWSVEFFQKKTYTNKIHTHYDNQIHQIDVFECLE